MFMILEPNQGIMRITVRALVTTGALFSRFLLFWSLGIAASLIPAHCKEALNDLTVIHIVDESLSASHTTSRSY